MKPRAGHAAVHTPGRYPAAATHRAEPRGIVEAGTAESSSGSTGGDATPKYL